MTGALIILCVTVVVGVILYLTRDKSSSGEALSPDNAVEPQQEECCGRHVVCEKGILEAADLYYNDEELDRFTGRDPDGYDEDETEEFREVLYTLRSEEVYRWGVALTQRDIALPTPLRDEWIILCREKG